MKLGHTFTGIALVRIHGLDVYRVYVRGNCLKQCWSEIKARAVLKELMQRLSAA